MATIQWYPGHMAKAKREIQERLKQVDLVLEVVDARLPESSRNPMLRELIGDKAHLLLLNKADLADPQMTQAWQKYYQREQQPVLALDSQHGQPLRPVLHAAKQILAPKIAAQQQKGVLKTTIRAMCIGIPNSGKSTFLNRLAGKNIAPIGNRPGVTRKQNWLKTKDDFEVLDTPGVLWPKFEDPTVGQKLALTGAIKEGLYHEDDITLFALGFYQKQYPQILQQTYQLTAAQLDLPAVELLLLLTKQAGFRDDYDRMAAKFLLYFRKGKLGRITLDLPPVGWEATVADD
ncbi:ribosome biogenesis GTPase YlqF [Lapidilactobacillus achengensis]|uniref:Ribosome biogenesis GTPase A n=1 Tax=Lapidilactobacillus achengensis TaxID=2486000 RepID=A0ABW1UPF5_9LACO|nr:ribosome biogenesis GTPase YlqF [Lapidilactobacillus achengensis]